MFGSIDDDSEEKNDTKRKSRNLSEKKRRDHFNLLVNELSVMVSLKSRKMDKSTVLKSTIGFLKNHNEVAVRSKEHEITDDWKPSFVSNEEFTHLILEALDSFIIVFSSTGRILYASEGVTALLGYLPSDVFNMTIYDMANEEQHSYLYNILRNPPAVVASTAEHVASEEQIRFECHLKRGELDYSEEVSYEEAQFTGFFRNNFNTQSLPTGVPSRCEFPNEFDSKIIFVGTCRIRKPQLLREMSIQNCSKSEFTSRHSLEWKFLFLDLRAPPIIGYLPFEVLGTSGYDYYHFDDLEQVVACHEAREGTSCYYRFLTKGQQWLWLQTCYYITYHQWTSKPEFVMCTHRVVNYVDVVQQMRRNNGHVEEVNDVNDSADSVERQLNTSASSMIITSPLSTRSVQSRWYDKNGSPSQVLQQHSKYSGPGSEDTTNSDGPASDHQSVVTQHQSSKIRPYSQSVKTSPKRHTTFRSSTSYIEDSSEFVNKFSLISQPSTSFHAPLMFATTAAPTLVITSPQPSHLQVELQRKQEELQQTIVNQQDELRRVSEQLLLARFGGPVVSVALPIAPTSVAIPAVISLSEIPATTYVHHLQQHDHSPAMSDAMQVDRDDLQHQRYSSRDGHVELDQRHHQHSMSLEHDEVVSYMELQPATSLHHLHHHHHQHHQQHQLPHQHQHQQYLIQNDNQSAIQTDTSRGVDQIMHNAETPEKRRQL